MVVQAVAALLRCMPSQDDQGALERYVRSGACQARRRTLHHLGYP